MPHLRRRPSVGTILGTLALFVSLGGVGYSATGGTFILGNANTATTPSSLSAPVAGKTLQLTNTSTGVGATALGLSVASGKPPFTVNSSTKVTNLNADRLDGLDSTAFARAARLDWRPVLPQTGPFSGAPGQFRCLSHNGAGTCLSYWRNYGAPWSSAAYAKDAFGIVHLKGLITCVDYFNTSCTDNPAFYLPVGYRPAENQVFAVSSNRGFGNIYIYVDYGNGGGGGRGDVVLHDGSPTTWTSLDGITFPAA